MQGTNNGWICLHRSLIEHELWTEEKFTRGQAWVDLLLLANHKAGAIRRRGIKVNVKRGEVGIGLRELAARWKWSVNKVRRYFDELKADQQLHYRTDTENVSVTTLICITNYQNFQSMDTETNTETDTRRIQNNNENNENKKNRGNFTPPSIEEITAYCLKRNNGVDPQRWFDFYQSKGWMVGKNKMKDWQAAIRTWEKPVKESAPPNIEESEKHAVPLASYLKAIEDHENGRA